MYKVFLADDEVSMREGIRSSIDWDASEFSLAGEAPDGELALSLILEIKPDILITDVRMPFMDGIELSKQVKQLMPWVRIVILSGHDEFEYAKQAVSIGVEEYLLKPVTSEKLMETLGEIAERIQRDREKSQNVESLMQDAKRARTDSLLADLFYGKAAYGDALPLAAELGLELAANCYLVMLIELHLAAGENYEPLYRARAGVSGVLNDLGSAVFICQGLDRIVCALLGNEPSALEDFAYACAQAVQHEAERGGDVAATAAIGSVVGDVGGWPKSMADADAAKRYLSLVSKKQIVSFRDPAADSRYADVITKAKGYIQENFRRQDTSLHTVAGTVNISPNHFSTIFRQETGETFVNYLTKIRISHAKTLLASTHMRTADIGFESGYIDTHYFNYVFKKNAGMTPKEFRNK